MNEALEKHKNLAELILRNKLEEIQRCIKDINTDIKLKQEYLDKHNRHLKEIVDALMVLESGEQPIPYADFVKRQKELNNNE